MKTTAQMQTAYQARMLSSLIDPTLSARIASQVDNFNAHVNEFTPNRIAMRAILSEEGVSIIQIAAYEAYHGSLYHLSKVVSGPALQTAFENLVTQWSSTPRLGAGAKTILTRIGVDVYHLDTFGTP
jgi:hypothetical protein